MKFQIQVRSRTNERDVNTIHVVGCLEGQVTVFRSDGLAFKLTGGDVSTSSAPQPNV